MKYFGCFLVLFIFNFSLLAQYAPQAGEENSTAIPAASPLFVGWGTDCVVTRGPLDITDPGGATAGAGFAEAGNGTSDNQTTSLGDGGTAILTFEPAVRDGEGADFAVFENGFGSPQGDFLELAFVEVSSDGENFVRFPAVSLTDAVEGIGSFGTLDATKIHNLAGKYYGGFGVPFDLAEVADSAFLDVQNVTHVRLIDVVGTNDPEFATYDAAGNAVIDPYPTAFPSGGFDLDAVGVIHANDDVSVSEVVNNEVVTFFPNPIRAGETVRVTGVLRLFDMYGRLVFATEEERFVLPNLAAGIYFYDGGRVVVY